MYWLQTKFIRSFPDNCYWNGREYDDGDQITYENASPCKEYKCVNGIVELTHYMCPACTSRMHTIKLPWECCPRCIHLKWPDIQTLLFWNVIRSIAIPYLFVPFLYFVWIKLLYNLPWFCNSWVFFFINTIFSCITGFLNDRVISATF